MNEHAESSESAPSESAPPVSASRPAKPTSRYVYESGESEFRKGVFATMITLIVGILLVGAIKLDERRIHTEALCARRAYDACEQDDRCHVEQDGLATACPEDAPHCHDLCVPHG